MVEIIEREYYRLKVNATTFIKMAFWTLADMVQCTDGRTVQEKIGNINGISDSITSPSSTIAASTTAVKNVEDKLAFFVTGTLTAGATTIAIKNSKIKSTSIIELYNDIYGTSATDVIVANGSITLEYPPLETNLNIKIRVLNL